MVISLSSDSQILQQKAEGGKVNYCGKLVQNTEGGKWSNEIINMFFSDFNSKRRKGEN